MVETAFKVRPIIWMEPVAPRGQSPDMVHPKRNARQFADFLQQLL